MTLKPAHRSDRLHSFRWMTIFLLTLGFLGFSGMKGHEAGHSREHGQEHKHGHKHKHRAPRHPVVDGQVVYQGPGRDEWQKPDQVIAALKLREGMTVADLGSGTGYFTFRLSNAVGAGGRVYAVDIEPEMNAYVQDQARQRHAENVTVVLAEMMDPKLPEPVDVIFSVNAFHHLEHRSQYFRDAAKYLKPGGRVVLIDFREGAYRHFTRKQTLLDELVHAGYTLVVDHDFLPRQNFLVFHRAGMN